MERQKTVYITGHRHPDMDSIASAIAYALLLQRKGMDAVPCRLGKINAETKWLLERFGFEAPMLFEDARATIREIEMDPPLIITPDTTIYETLQLMQKHNKQSYGVVNEKGQLMGMVTRSDLASIGLGDTAASIQLLKETPLDNIARTLSGRLVYMDDDYHFNGKVSIIAMTETGLSNYDIKDRLVLLGNDKEAQKAAIRKRCRRAHRRMDRYDPRGGPRTGQSPPLSDHHLRTWNDEHLPLPVLRSAGPFDHDPLSGQLQYR